MIRKLSLFLSVSVIILFSGSCNEEGVEPEETKTDLSVVSELVEEIRVEFDVVYEELGKKADRETMLEVLDKSKSKREFFANIQKITSPIYDEAYKLLIAKYDVKSDPSAFTRDAELVLTNALLLVDEASVPPYFDVNGDIMKALDSKMGNFKGDAIEIFDSFISNGIHQSLPEKTFSLSLDKTKSLVEFVATVEQKVLDDDLEQAIQDLIGNNDIPEPIVGLLLPAIQQANESGKQRPYFDYLTNLFGETPEINGEIVRRMDAAQLFASLSYLLDKNFSGGPVESVTSRFIRLQGINGEIILLEEFWKVNQE